jgi:hypothetical protein
VHRAVHRLRRDVDAVRLPGGRDEAEAARVHAEDPLELGAPSPGLLPRQPEALARQRDDRAALGELLEQALQCGVVPRLDGQAAGDLVDVEGALERREQIEDGLAAERSGGRHLSSGVEPPGLPRQ